MASVKLGDDFFRVPKLDVGGTNWVLYKERLVWVADAEGLAGHLDRMSVEPVVPPVTAGKNVTAPAGSRVAGATAAPAAAGGKADAAAGATGGGTVAAVPVVVTPGPGTVPDPAQTAYQTELATWKKGEAIVKQVVASTIPDSLFMKVRAKGTAHAIWKSFPANERICHNTGDSCFLRP